MQKDDAIADDSTTIELSRSELRAVAGYAVACAQPALAIFERERPDDRRPRAAIDAAQAFADGGERTKPLRDSAWAAHRAAQEARDAGHAAASDAARAAGHAVGAAFLHPLPGVGRVESCPSTTWDAASRAGRARARAGRGRLIDAGDARAVLEAKGRRGPRIVAISNHDSTPWTFELFAQVFGDRYCTLGVGEELQIEAPTAPATLATM